MKKLLILITIKIIFSTLSYAKSDSTINLKVDRFIQKQELINIKRAAEIKSIQEFENEYEIKESLFSNQLNILTTIFSAIVAISIFIIGYLIPKLNDEKHKVELEKLHSEFETIRDEIKKSRELTAKIEAQNDYNHSKLMYFSCSDTGSKNGTILWALRLCKASFVRFKEADDKDVEFYVDSAFTMVSELEKETSLKEYVDEVNNLVSELLEMYSVKDYKEKFIFIKEEYNKKTWATEFVEKK